jgi:hypothetical protein
LHVRYAQWCAALPRTLHFAVDAFSRELRWAPSDVGLLEDISFVRWLVMPAVSRYLSASAGAQRQSMTTRKDLQSDFQDFASFDIPGALESIPGVHFDILLLGFEVVYLTLLPSYLQLHSVRVLAD